MKKKAVKKAVKKSAPKLTHDNAVYATAIVGAKKFTSVGVSPLEALMNLKPGVVRGKVILVMERDGKKQERVLTNFMATRLFNTRGLSQEVHLKNVSLLFAI